MAWIKGSNYADDIDGTAYGDRIEGFGGDDWIWGYGGNDLLFGGTGNDILTGGGGADDFHFDSALNSASNVDRIADFQVGSDAILLDRDIFTRVGLGTLSPGAFVEGTRAFDAGDRILYDQDSGRIFYDADGSGAAAARLFAIVTPGTDLIASDFIGY